MMATRLRSLYVSILICVGLSVANAQMAPSDASIADEYESGMELYRKGQYANSQRLLDQVVADDFKHDRETRATAAYYAALAAMKLYNGDADKRVDDFARNFELSPLVNNLYFRFANYRFSLKRYRDAAEYYDKVDKFRLSNSDRPEYFFKKAYAHLSIEEPDRAKPLFFELKNGDSKYATSARYYYAHLLYADSNYTEALSNFLPLRGDEAFGPLIPYYLAHIYYQLGDYEKLLEVGEELIENATPSRAPEIAKLMGDAFYTRADYPNAVKYLQLYQEKGGKMRRKDHFQLGYSLYKTGDYKEAINSFNKITRGNGNESLQQNAYYHLGDLYLKQNDRQKAMTAFKAASEIEVSPTIREDAYFNYAKLAYELSDPFQDAITTLNNYLDEFPESPNRREINRLLANLYITTKDYERALEAIERTGINSPGMKDAYQKIAFYRGNELFASLMYEAALNKYDESLKYPVNPTITALSHYWKAESQYKLANYAEAAASFEQFRAMPGAFNMSEFLYSLYGSGYAYYKQFDFQEAAKAFRTYTRDASRKDKRLPDAYLRLADSYLMTGGYLLAADFYNSAIKTGSSETDYALYQRAECLGLAGKPDAKIGELESLLKRYPKSVYAEEAEFEIASTYLKQDNYEKAISGFDRFISSHPSSAMVPDAQLQKGLAYSNADRNNEALAVYRQIVEKHPGSEASVEAVGLARLVYARQNRIDEYLDWVEDIEFVNFSRSAMDSTAFGTAFDQYSSGDCEGAITALQGYLSRFDDKGLFRLQANYYLAECAARLNRGDEARKAYQAIAEMPQNKYSGDALAYLAEAYWREKNYPEARKHYQRWLKIADKNTSITAAQTGLMRSNYAVGDYEQALLYAELLLQKPKLESSVWQLAQKIQALSMVEKGRWAEAIGSLDTLIAGSAGELKAEAYYLKAQVKHQQKQYQESNDIVYKLIEEVPDYKEWKLRALILSGRNFWRQDDIFQANYTLDYVISSGFSTEIVDEAQNLKDQIAVEERNKAEQKKQELQSQSDSLLLDQGDGLMIIDEAESKTDSLQNQ